MSISVVILGRDDRLVRQIEGYHGELIVVRVCDEAAEAIAACSTTEADVLLVAGRELLPPMEQVDVVLSQRTAVAVLDGSPGSDPAVPGLVEISDNTGMVELEQQVQRAIASLADHPGGSDETDLGPGGGERGREGKIICFWSAVGSPGRSTVALNYAAEAVAHGQSVVLVDADTYGASIAIQLGLLDEAASIAQLCRIIDSGSRDPARLAAACLTVQVGDATMKVATGIPRASRWPEVRAAALRRAAFTLRAHHDLVVFDLAALIEMDEQLSFDTQAPQRNAVAVEMLKCADEVIMIVAADSVGLPRALRALDELDVCVPGLQPKIVFNRVSAANSGRSPVRRLLEAWDRFGPSHPVVGFLPNDNVVCHAAVLAGSPLLEIAPKSSLRSEIRSLTDRKSTVSASNGRSRRLLRKS